MKRFWICVTILAITFFAALGNGLCLNLLTEELTDRLELAQYHAQRQDWAAAKQLTEQALEQWEDAEDYLYIVLRHDETDAVAQQFQEVAQLLNWGEEAEYTSANARLIEDIELLAEMETFSLKNLL